MILVLLNRRGKREDIFRRLLNRCVLHGTSATGTRRSRLGGQVEQAATLRLVHGRTIVGDPGEDNGDQRAVAK